MSYCYDDDRDDYRPARRYYGNCGGFASYSGPCGAPDCSSCRNGSMDEAPLEGALARAEDAGYTVDAEDGVATKQISSKIRVARRDHKSGLVKAGDRYRETVWRTIFEDGTSKLERLVVKLPPAVA